MFQNSFIAKSTMCALLAALPFAPAVRPVCSGPNCRSGQCSRPATIVLQAVPVNAAPQLYTSGLGDDWVLVREPVAVGPAEDLVSPMAEELSRDVKAEVEDAALEQAEGSDPATEDDQETAKDSGTRDATKTASSTKTREVWMRASDARAAGLLPTASSASRGGFGSSGSGVAMAAPVAYEQVTYTQSYGCTGSGYSAFYGQPVATYQQAAPTYYRTRRVLFPNLFPRLRGLR